MTTNQYSQTQSRKVTRATQTYVTDNVQIHIQLAPSDDRQAQRLYAVNQVLMWALQQNEIDKQQGIFMQDYRNQIEEKQKVTRRKIAQEIEAQTRTSLLKP
jgi:hypothetical protein